MKSDLPKVLHPVAGRPMIRHVTDAVSGAGLDEIVVVIGPDGDGVRATLGDAYRYVIQDDPRGTGDAARRAASLLQGAGRVLVVNGDAPLLTSGIVRHLTIAHEAASEPGEAAPAATLATAFLDDPTGYGRIVRGSGGHVEQIVEETDADDLQRAIREIYTGLALFEAAPFLAALDRLEAKNVQGEFYLTDAVGNLRRDGQRVAAWIAPDPEPLLGVNDRVELARADAALRRKRLVALMREGVTVIDPTTTFVDAEVEVGRDTTLYPFTILEGATRVGARCRIGPGAHLVSCRVADGAEITRSVVEDSDVGEGARVGPFAHVRPGSTLDDGVEVGNFAEIKASRLGRGTKAHHHSYVGDADLGERVNVGAGVVTVNYDGREKHRTIVGDEAFLGCNVNLVAPLKVGERSYLAAGSTLTHDVPAEALAIARERQTNKDGWAARRHRGG